MLIDPLEALPGYALRRASAAAMTQLAGRLEAIRLRPAEATVLMVIEANPGVTQSDVGRLLDIASANMAPLVSRLHKRELVDRERVDGRSQGLRLTAAGRRLAVRIRKTVAEHEATLLTHVPVSQRSTLLAALRAIRAIWKSADQR